MTEKDNRQPVEQRHIDFGREVVALARKHGVHDVQATFYGGRHDQRWTRVTMSWHQGRHGERSGISFKAEATHNVSEVENG